MTLRAFALLSCVLLFVPAEQNASDPLSGRWESDGLPYFELTYDGKGSVSGTTIWRYGSRFEHRAAIQSGTYDPDTRTITLEGDTKQLDGAVVRYLIQGTLDNGTIRGTYQAGDAGGEFTFTRLRLDRDPAAAKRIAAARAVAGRWTGHMGPDDARREPITVELNATGKEITGSVTGPPYPGKITKGAYDDATGALMLQVVVQDESRTAATFEGTVTGNTAAGRVLIGGLQAGTFHLTRQEK